MMDKRGEIDMIEVFKDKCTKCQLCINDCPSKIIRADKEGFPKVIKKFERFCIDCGHCFSICPTAALQFRGAKPESKDKLNIDVSPEQLEFLIKHRRSIRHYKEDIVSNETLESLMGLTQYTPSGSNARPVNFTVVSGKEATDHIVDLCMLWVKENEEYTELISEMRRGNNLITCGAPHLIFAYAENEIDAKIANPLEDSIIALSTIEIAARGYELGACWGGYLQLIGNKSSEIKKYLKIKNEENIWGAIMLGYPKFQYQRIPNRMRNKINWL